MKANAQKNTLLKNGESNTASIFLKRVFFSPSHEEFFPPLFFLFFFRHRMGIVLNSTDSASNINLLGQNACKLDTSPLRTDRRASGNSYVFVASGGRAMNTLLYNNTMGGAKKLDSMGKLRNSLQCKLDFNIFE